MSVKVRWEADVNKSLYQAKVHNGNLAATSNVGAGKPEDSRNEGDRATPHYVYRSGMRMVQAV